MPSRLEGMETAMTVAVKTKNTETVYMCLPVWREWKPYPMGFRVVWVFYCLHVPSRLEGMETLTLTINSLLLTFR